ncbi:PAS domain-containing protein [Photobacterium sp. MCCC 1A19761]|uniref:PAS domain-containing protein n=1 Tax=Photobacterium sp. MCCC 1A19761 TaxID=3115000 RepID=UPI00307DF4C1
MTKTNLEGKITYANRTFMRVANYSELELLGKDHNLIRHPDMPKGVFYGMWKTLKSGEEFFGFVKNSTADGNYYWVFANITPDHLNGQMIGFYSVRRYASKAAIQEIERIYQKMREIEQSAGNKQAGETSWQWLADQIQREHQMGYEEYVLSLYEKHQ